jgi:hypothetical protein
MYLFCCKKDLGENTEYFLYFFCFYWRFESFDVNHLGFTRKRKCFCTLKNCQLNPGKRFQAAFYLSDEGNYISWRQTTKSKREHPPLFPFVAPYLPTFVSLSEKTLFFIKQYIKKVRPEGGAEGKKEQVGGSNPGICPNATLRSTKVSASQIFHAYQTVLLLGVI